MSKRKNRLVKKNLTATQDFTKQMQGRVLPYDLQAVYQVRIDIQQWGAAEMLAQNLEPRTWYLQNIFQNKVSKDTLLTSQIENRKQQLFAADFLLKKSNGDVDEEQTLALKNSVLWRQITNAILDAHYYWYSVGEIVRDGEGSFSFDVLPRQNTLPQTGIFYKNYLEQSNPVKYRELPEYGTWILEFTGDKLGLLNKVTPHVLMKNFAQSCWSELCEIYGIPARVMKTNTRDRSMLNRAQQMVKDMGAAAWFIIDNNENFEWAQPVITNGDVYANLIRLCNNEISMAISGAIVGQDTVNGSNSKEQTSQNLLSALIDSDINRVEQAWNDKVIPALLNIGFLKGDLRLEFDAAEDIEQLFKFTQGLLPFKEIDNDWIEDKFGVKVIGDKAAPAAMGFGAGSDFFV
jgi:hypothetical protein